MNGKLLPLGASDFSTLRSSNMIYVDKTALIYELASTAKGKFFLSRPRRFGKSLLVSTFDSLFKHGLRDFEGLAIEHLWKESITYPVLHLDFSKVGTFFSLEEFKKKVASVFRRSLVTAGIPVTGKSYEEIIEALDIWITTRRESEIVLLIDEYDAPLTQCLEKPKLFERVKASLTDFYSVVKGNDACWRFVFITGIAKFAKMSIFSGMNNLKDITLSQEYGTLLGYSEEEILGYFGEYIDNAIRKIKHPKFENREALVAELERQYDGFCFDKGGLTRLYSPWSVLNFFFAPIDGFENYWYESGGRATALMEFIKGHSFKDPVAYRQKKEIRTNQLNLSADAEHIDELALLTQTGYLTIKSVENGVLTLDYPNEEVKRSIAQLYADNVLDQATQTIPMTTKFVESVCRGSAEKIVQLFNKIILGTTYTFASRVDEVHIQALFGLTFSMAGFDPHYEKPNAEGRSDLEVTLGRRRLVIEFKVKRAGDNEETLLQEAVSQIKTRDYGTASFSDEILRIAMVYSTEVKRFVKWAEVPLSSIR